MKTIIIDTNLWLAPFEKKVDIVGQLDRLLEEPFEIVVPRAVFDELSKMSRHAGRRGNAARSALAVIERNADKIHPIAIVEEKGVADGAIMTAAKQKNALVATNDFLLRRRLKEKKITTLSLRDGHKIDYA